MIPAPVPAPAPAPAPVPAPVEEPGLVDQLQELLKLVVTLGLTAAAAVLLLWVAWWVWQRRRHRRVEEHSLSISGRMASENDASQRNKHLDPQRPWQVFGQVVDSANGKITDTLLADDSHSPIDLYGGPGAGKSASLIVPTILRYPGAALISTTKTDLAKATLTARARRGGTIRIFDPAGEARSEPALRDHTAVWTPLTEGVTWARAMAVAEGLLSGVQGGSNTSNSNEFFHLHQVNLVAVLLVILRAQKGTSLHDFSKALQALNPPPAVDGEAPNAAEAWAALNTQLEGLRQEQQVAIEAAEAAQAFEALEDAQDRQHLFASALAALASTSAAASAPETRAGILGSVGQVEAAWLASRDTLHQAWDDPNTIDPTDLVQDDDSTLYLVCPHAVLRPLNAALLGAYIQALTTRANLSGGALPRQRLVVLDELTYCTPHSQLSSWMGNFARSAKVKILICMQSYANLVSVYGEQEARVIHNACSGGHVLLACSSDPGTFELFMQQAGKKDLWLTQSVTTTTATGTTKGKLSFLPDSSNSGKTTSKSKTLVERDVVTAARLSAMKVFHAVVILKGTEKDLGLVAQVRCLPWFEDPEMQRAAAGDPAALTAIQQPPPPPRRTRR